jgi:hypothetical protein
MWRVRHHRTRHRYRAGSRDPLRAHAAISSLRNVMASWSPALGHADVSASDLA